MKAAPNIESLRAIFSEHQLVVAESAAQLLPTLSDCVELARRCLAGGGKIIACGNGGSAADAQHFIAELVGRYDKPRAPLAGIVLGTDAATMTAVSNDFGFEHVFSRQVDTLARSGDVLIALSTSGNSRNVINAAVTALKSVCAPPLLASCRPAPRAPRTPANPAPLRAPVLKAYDTWSVRGGSGLAAVSKYPPPLIGCGTA